MIHDNNQQYSHVATHKQHYLDAKFSKRSSHYLFLNTFSVMIIFILLLLLTKLQIILFSAQGIGAHKLFSTQSKHTLEILCKVLKTK